MLQKTHLEKLEAFLLNNESLPDINCSKETWLNYNDNFNGHLINGSNDYLKKNRTNVRGGS